MNIAKIIDALDKQIADLQKARTLLVGEDEKKTMRGPGRPKKTAAAPTTTTTTTKQRRVMSPEAKERIAAAQKARWARAKKKA